MIKMLKRYFTHKDDRGCLEGIINFGEWKELNIITSSFNTIRGNHYHKETTEIFIILDGEIKVVAQKVVGKKLVGEPFEEIVKAGDVFMIEPMINHTFYLLKDSRWMNLLSEPMARNNSDIHRLEI